MLYLALSTCVQYCTIGWLVLPPPLVLTHSSGLRFGRLPVCVSALVRQFAWGIIQASTQPDGSHRAYASDFDVSIPAHGYVYSPSFDFVMGDGPKAFTPPY